MVDPTSPPTVEPTAPPASGPTASLTASPTDQPTTTSTTAEPADQATPNPTPNPTPRPSLRPTPRPTPSSAGGATPNPTWYVTWEVTDQSTVTDCVNDLTMTQSCYAPGSRVQVNFESCDPSLDDWIGIYPNPGSIDPTMLDDPPVWGHTCGSSTSPCTSDPVSRGYVIFSATIFSNEGSFGVYLASGGDQPPYPSLARTTFRISSNC
jgi:hypothetical protein